MFSSYPSPSFTRPRPKYKSQIRTDIDARHCYLCDKPTNRYLIFETSFGEAISMATAKRVPLCHPCDHIHVGHVVK